jgi:hypothetical protein
MTLCLLLACLALLTLAAPVHAASADQAAVAAQLAGAKKGAVITLAARTYDVGDLVVPDGVTLRGAGYDQTILNAAGHANGVVIQGRRGARVTDLAVRNARESGVLVSQSTEITLARLSVIGNLTGLLLDRVSKGRIENLVVAKNRTGASLAGNADTVLANCSFVDNTAIALTVSGAARVAIFNNLFVNSPTGVYLTAANTALALDHNLYIASFLGKLEGEVTRTTLAGWQRLSGHDTHSLSQAVEFADPARDDYRPVSRLPWAPALATTSDWGTPTLLGLAAPATDITGAKRAGTADLGAYETTFPAERAPDGYFTIASADGVKSAGLYTPDGVNVAILFQNKPLRTGKHAFWLPSRDYQNRPIPAGAYEVRVVESQLTNPYLGLAGNFGRTSKGLDNCAYPEEMFAFDATDRLYIAQNAFENGMGVRAFDAAYTTPRWMMPGGGGTVGVATDATWIYYLQRASGKYNLRKINLESGVMEAIAPGAGNRIFTAPFSETVAGMTLLDGTLYVADAGKGKIFHTPATDPTFAAAFDLPDARSVTADAKTHLLWAISTGDTLIALDPATGAVKAKSTPVDGATVISANNGRLAVLSPKTGKIHLFDCSDPANLRPLRTLGTGDGPFGPQRPDRFWFQTAARSGRVKMHVALNSLGEVAVVDGPRISFWAADGTVKKQGLGIWGQHNYLGKLAGDDDVRIWEIAGKVSIKMDCKNKRWTPDIHWELPPYTYDGRPTRNFFTAGGKNFGVFAVKVGDPGKVPDGTLKLTGFDPKQQSNALLVMRLDGGRALPVTLYYWDSAKKTLCEAHDTNGDSLIDAADGVRELKKADGAAVSIPGARYDGLPRLNGDLVYTNASNDMTTGSIIKMAGLDPTGTYPVYDWANPELIPCKVDQTAKFTSPYDFKTIERVNGTVQIAPLSDGGYASSIGLRTSGGTGLANGAGTDIAGFSKDGRLRWLFKLNFVQGSEGVQSIPEYGLVLGMTSTQCDYMVVDEDGLGLGALSMPQEAHWHGMWSDHAQQQQAWVGNDGKPYYILGDYAVNGYHWFAITGTEKTRRQRIPVVLDAARADVLATLPGRVPEKLPVPPTTKVTIRRLTAPLPIDGDLKKWRTAGIAPAALVTPETGSADIAGPQDCSALIRLAYHGVDLYVQTLVFDNAVTFHQPLDRMYQQDGIEMAINSFMEGFKYNVARTTDTGPTVFRNKFVVKKADRVYTEEQVPRSITVLESAKDVEERKYIEAIYGVDLTKSKVIVTEFKLPLTQAVAFDGDPTLLKEVAPGKTCWLGFFINDNDIPGGDVQKYLAWPATYGTFATKDCGALATFE